MGSGASALPAGVQISRCHSIERKKIDTAQVIVPYHGLLYRRVTIPHLPPSLAKQTTFLTPHHSPPLRKTVPRQHKNNNKCIFKGWTVLQLWLALSFAFAFAIPCSCLFESTSLHSLHDLLSPWGTCMTQHHWLPYIFCYNKGWCNIGFLLLRPWGKCLFYCIHNSAFVVSRLFCTLPSQPIFLVASCWG
jgi:hypothetical protein